MPNSALPGNLVRSLTPIALGAVALGGVLWMLWGGTAPPERIEADRAPRRETGHWEAVALGQQHLDNGRPDLALKSVMHIRDDGPGAGEAMTVAGVALFRLGEPMGARQALEVALNFQPDQPEAALALAALYLKMGDTARGLSYLERAAKGAPDDARPWLEMGKIHHDLGESPRAAEAFREALERAPDDTEARIGLIASLLDSVQFERATPEIAEALERSPDDPSLLGLAARHALALGRRDEALGFASRALDRDPENVEALLVRARVHHDTGEPEQALDELERVVSIRPNNLGALQLLGKVETQLGLTERAAETAARHGRAHERALRMNELAEEIVLRPDDPEPRSEMGRLALEGGSTELARRCFEAALLFDPKHRPALDGLAAIDSSAPDLAGPTPDARSTATGR